MFLIFSIVNYYNLSTFVLILKLHYRKLEVILPTRYEPQIRWVMGIVRVYAVFSKTFFFFIFSEIKCFTFPIYFQNTSIT